jgi:hypothetical protein
LDSPVRQRLEHEIYVQFRDIVAVNADRRDEVGRSLSFAVARASDRVTTLVQRDMTEARIAERVADLKAEWNESLADGTWLWRFPGRAILQGFVHQHVGELRYERFRNLVLAKMRSAGYEPPEMRKVVAQILDT